MSSRAASLCWPRDRSHRPAISTQHFGLTEAITQSLAGRIALLHLLPLSLDEVRRFPGPGRDLWETVWAGGYPRIHDRGLHPAVWLGDYTATYVQRDVRQVLRVGDLDAFTAFLRLAAGRTGQEENQSRLGADAGVSCRFCDEAFKWRTGEGGRCRMMPPMSVRCLA